MPVLLPKRRRQVREWLNIAATAHTREKESLHDAYLKPYLHTLAARNCSAWTLICIRSEKCHERKMSTSRVSVCAIMRGVAHIRDCRNAVRWPEASCLD